MKRTLKEGRSYVFVSLEKTLNCVTQSELGRSVKEAMCLINAVNRIGVRILLQSEGDVIS